MYYSYLLATIFLIVAVVIGVIGIILIVVLALAMVKNVHKETKFHEEVRCMYFICINTLLL